MKAVSVAASAKYLVGSGKLVCKNKSTSVISSEGVVTANARFQNRLCVWKKARPYSEKLVKLDDEAFRPAGVEAPMSCVSESKGVGMFLIDNLKPPIPPRLPQI